MNGRHTRLRLLLFAFVLGVGVGCDHATKQAAMAWLTPGDPISLLGDALRFELVRNPGAFLSLGSQLDPGVRDLLFLGLAPLALLVLVAWFVRTRTTAPPQIVGLALVAGGGLANWIDRMMHAGAVTDFMSLGVGPLRSGIFNVADLWIGFGVGVLAWSLRVPAGKPGPATP
jgi:signal peptidase II